MWVRLQSLGASLVDDVPYSDCLVIGRWKNILASRMPNYSSHPIVMANQRKETETDTDIPNFDGLISWTTDKERTCSGPFVLKSRGRSFRKSIGNKWWLTHITSCCLTNWRKSRFRSPSYTFYCVIMVFQDSPVFSGTYYVISYICIPNQDCL